MSPSPKMIDCPQCAHVVMANGIKVTVSTGKITRYVHWRGRDKDVTIFQDTCEKCGGSGRVIAHNQKIFDTKTLALKKKQKVIMSEWLAQAKDLVYAVKE